jgi:hypothetical protein
MGNGRPFPIPEPAKDTVIKGVAVSLAEGRRPRAGPSPQDERGTVMPYFLIF